MSGELNGKTAIITGGSRGIGLACAEALSSAGANVVITGRDVARGEEAAKALPNQARFMQQDVASDEDWTRVMAATKDAFGRVDIVVANAGVSSFFPLEAMSLEEFRRLNEINLKGAFLGVKHGAIALREHGEGGSIILMSSVMGRISAPANTHYSASKSGVRLLAKAAALELGAEKIRVNCVLPGITHSDMTAAFDEVAMAPVLVPQKRFGEAKEVADAVLFASSDRSIFMTGADLVVDGGLITR
ncbi:MAG: SDR family NAD(P)-dependent oxidoreductase [Pseudomonadota bacterium]